jgi:hypothetical protein
VSNDVCVVVDSVDYRPMLQLPATVVTVMGSGRQNLSFSLDDINILTDIKRAIDDALGQLRDYETDQMERIPDA